MPEEKNKNRDGLSSVLSELRTLVAKVGASDMISEKEAADLVGVQFNTMQQRRYDGTIPKNAYAKAVTGGYIYFKSKLIKNEKSPVKKY